MNLADNLSNMLALETALVVGRALQFVLYATVDENELISFGIPGEVFVLTATAVKTKQSTLLAKNADGLVHDTAVHTNILVFCALTNLSEFHLLNLVVAEQIVQSESISALESCT